MKTEALLRRRRGRARATSAADRGSTRRL